MTLDWLKNIDPDTLAKFAALEVKRDDDWFLKESIEIIMVMPDSTQVYKFWRANLDCLNEDLLTILKQWANKNRNRSGGNQENELHGIGWNHYEQAVVIDFIANNSE